MRSITELKANKIQIVLTDIDDTLTDQGRVKPETYTALWRLRQSGFTVIPVTGRPAGWCELIARQWPVDWVIGENGAFAFGVQKSGMTRFYYKKPTSLESEKKKLKAIEKKILKAIPRCKVSSDQFSRIYDLAIDFAEDVRPPLKSDQVQKIKDVFEKSGATAKISSIHVNGWFGSHDKLKMCHKLLLKYYFKSHEEILEKAVFIGDSPNDEPMFKEFPNSVGVASVKNYLDILKFKPAYITESEGGDGFVELANTLIKQRST